jgi:hypothetical protein
MARKRRSRSPRKSKAATPLAEREVNASPSSDRDDREASRQISTAHVDRDMIGTARDEDLEPGFPGNDWEARPGDVE